ncbi:unnamed protein product [Pleuronectes platessa]|uniref:Uncharacterized protein n=1 Tax=Pleuronectes platessa TaxID=8262 RepID=A0A9N7Z898_PLEPL|nr:unnamed protein product [Pleuronectes platessa]
MQESSLFVLLSPRQPDPPEHQWRAQKYKHMSREQFLEKSLASSPIIIITISTITLIISSRLPRNNHAVVMTAHYLPADRGVSGYLVRPSLNVKKTTPERFPGSVSPCCASSSPRERAPQPAAPTEATCSSSSSSSFSYSPGVSSLDRHREGGGHPIT